MYSKGKYGMKQMIGGNRVISQDGYIRLTPEAMVDVQLKHMISGLDQEENESRNGGTSRTRITGYTEWVSNDIPYISLGWDWELDVISERLSYVRTGEARSNIMMVNSHYIDLGRRDTREILGSIIDVTDWKIVVHQYVTEKYRYL